MTERDPCCWLCKTPSGICATKRTCEHHQIAARLTKEAGRLTYPDPVGDRAARNVDRQRKKRRKEG